MLQDSGTLFHLYADDTQLYISSSAKDSNVHLARLSTVLDLLFCWFTENRLSVNPSKTEFLLIGTPQQRQKLISPVLDIRGTPLQPSDSVRNLGVIVDSELSFSEHFSSIRRSSHFLIRQLRQIRSSLNLKSSILLANSLLTSKVDFCNSLYFGLLSVSISKLQLVQNSLARAVFPSTRCSSHIMPVLRTLYWMLKE